MKTHDNHGSTSDDTRWITVSARSGSVSFGGEYVNHVMSGAAVDGHPGSLVRTLDLNATHSAICRRQNHDPNGGDYLKVYFV